MLGDLAERGFIVRYEVDGRPYIEIPKFSKHQAISGKEREKESEIPAPNSINVPVEFQSSSSLVPELGQSSSRIADIGHRTYDIGHRTKDTDVDVGAAPPAADPAPPTDQPAVILEALGEEAWKAHARPVEKSPETGQGGKNRVRPTSTLARKAKTPCGAILGVEALADTPQTIFDAWNALADTDGVRLEKAIMLTPDRRTHAKARLSEPFFRKHWREALEVIRSDKFYQGCGAPRSPGEKPWVASLDYFLKPKTVVKLIERRARNRSPMVHPDGVYVGDMDPGFKNGMEDDNDVAA
jgi:hypothetical protein